MRNAVVVSSQLTEQLSWYRDGLDGPTLRPSQPPIQWVPRPPSPGVKQQGRQADKSPLSSAEVKNGGAIPPLPYMSSWHSA
jgi:hypothetical protein